MSIYEEFENSVDLGGRRIIKKKKFQQLDDKL